MANNSTTQSASDETNANSQFNQKKITTLLTTKSLPTLTTTVFEFEGKSSPYYPSSFSEGHLNLKSCITPNFNIPSKSNETKNESQQVPTLISRDAADAVAVDFPLKRSIPKRGWSPRTSMYWILQYSNNDSQENESNNHEGDGKDTRNNQGKYDFLDLQKPLETLNNSNSESLMIPKRPPDKYLDYFMLFRKRRRRAVRRRVDGRLFLPVFRSQFLAKVMMVKTVKWLTASTITLSASYYPAVMDYARRHVWMLIIPVLLYVAIYVIIRRCESCLPNCAFVFAIIIYICCVAMIAAILYSLNANALVPTVLLTLSISYLSTAILTCSTKMDVTRDSVISCVVLLIMSFSLMSFVAVFKLTGADDKSFSRQCGTIWFPSFIFTMSLSLIEMAEMKALLQGYSIDFGPQDWVIIAALLV